MRPRALCLDLDGTMFDTAPEMCIAANQALSLLGLPEVELAAARSYIGDGLRRFAKRLLTGDRWANPPDDQVERMLDALRERYAGVFMTRNSLYPGVAETLCDLAGAGWQMAVVTNKPRRYTEPMLAGFLPGIEFGHIVAGDDDLPNKPDPAGLRAAMEGLGVPPEKAVMVGDALADQKASRGAGVGHFVAAAYGYHPAELPGLEADHEIERFSDLRGFCARLEV